VVSERRDQFPTTIIMYGVQVSIFLYAECCEFMLPVVRRAFALEGVINPNKASIYRSKRVSVVNIPHGGLSLPGSISTNLRFKLYVHEVDS